MFGLHLMGNRDLKKLMGASCFHVTGTWCAHQWSGGHQENVI